LHEANWIKFKPDKSIMKLGPGQSSGKHKTSRCRV